MIEVIRHDGERIASLEVRMDMFEQQYQRIETKLDDLLTLKNKGAGVFWLATSLFGSSILVTVYYIVSALKHHWG